MRLSIIVPVYKVEPYLRRCVDSILAQTFADFELILVDDDSPDGCPGICDEYAQLDNRVRVIHKPNGGVSDARNAGLDMAQGEYIGFVDSDDYIHPQMYELLIQAASKANADIAAADFVWVQDDEGDAGECYNQSVYDTMVVLRRADFIDHFYPKNRFLLRPEVWNKVYRKEIFDALRFPQGRIFEDAFLQLAILLKANIAVKLPVVGYYYRVRGNSIMRSQYSFQNAKDITDVCQNNLRYYKTLKKWDQVQYALEDYLNYFCRDKFAIYFYYPEHKHEFRKYERLFSKEFWCMIIARHICTMKKIVLIFLYIHPKTALRICRRYFGECLYGFMRG